jgi:hypothetical protein
LRRGPGIGPPGRGNRAPDGHGRSGHKPNVALAALESLREFAPARFTPEQARRILAALDATLEEPVGALHRVLLEAFLATLRSAGAGVE